MLKERMMSVPSQVRVNGPLSRYFAGFSKKLADIGYTPNGASSQLRLMAHISRWLDTNNLTSAELTEPCVDEFLIYRRAEGYTQLLSRRATSPLLTYLRAIGVVPEASTENTSTPLGTVLTHYRDHLTTQRGLAEATICSYLHVARLFLIDRVSDDDFDFSDLNAGCVQEFILSECAQRSVGSSQYIACGMRALLRYLHASAQIRKSLTDAVPTVAGWRLTGLPKALTRIQVNALLSSCDVKTEIGCRDFAVLTLLVRLGLRAGEVAGLNLCDINWTNGELVVHGKGNRVEPLPLPADVGKAIVGWLRRRRRCPDCRRVFLRIRAPHGALSSCAVSCIVGAACQRAGIPKVGAHRLRHTAATEMLSAGAGLVEIGQVLRHTSELTTAIYAKVDKRRLRLIAKQWPEVVS